MVHLNKLIFKGDKMEITYQNLKSILPNTRLEDSGIYEDYVATIPEFILKYRNIIKREVLVRILCRDEFMPPKDLLYFAIWCAKKVEYILKASKNPSAYLALNALNMAKRYADGLISRDSAAFVLTMDKLYQVRMNADLLLGKALNSAHREDLNHNHFGVRNRGDWGYGVGGSGADGSTKWSSVQEAERNKSEAQIYRRFDGRMEWRFGRGSGLVGDATRYAQAVGAVSWIFDSPETTAMCAVNAEAAMAMGFPSPSNVAIRAADRVENEQIDKLLSYFIARESNEDFISIQFW